MFCYNQNPKIKQAQLLASSLHKGVVYGGGMNMLDQVNRTAELVAQSDADCDTVVAAYLHKCQETKRIAKGVQPLSADYVKSHFGEKVAAIVTEVSSEPEENKNQTKTEQWQEKTKWAAGLSKQAQTILLAEKVCNFETSCNKPNPEKAPEWHIAYFNTRMIMVEALKEANPKLYDMARDLADKGTKLHHMATIEFIRNNSYTRD